MKLNVTLLLDESGSMGSIKDDTIGGFNQYLTSLQAQDAEIAFTFLKFDSNAVTKVNVGTPVKDVPQLTRESYIPGASTPLIDAAMEAILATEKVQEAGSKTIFVIQTDGHENSSTKYQRQDLLAKIKEKTQEGWEFVYLGAGVDAYAEACAFGIGAANTVSYNRASSKQAFATLAGNTTAYVRSGGATGMAFTNKQREFVGDEYSGRQPSRADRVPAPVPPVAVTRAPVPPASATRAPAPSLVDTIDLSTPVVTGIDYASGVDAPASTDASSS